MEYITDPMKCKIILDVQALSQVTTKQLAEKHPDIPQATLYRLLKKMVADEILEVVAENKVRNVTEKVYALAFDSGNINVEVEKMIDENPGEMYFHLFQQFVMGLLGEMKDYAQREDIDLRADGVGMITYPFYANLEEVIELAIKIKEIMQPYLENEATPDRQMRSFARIFMPPVKEKK